MAVLFIPSGCGDARAHERLVVRAGATREDVPEQADAEVRVLVRRADVARQLVGDEEVVELLRRCSRRTGWPRPSARGSSGRRGSAGVCVARSCSVIFFPPRSGTFTSAGRYFATGSVSATSPRCTACRRGAAR